MTEFPVFREGLDRFSEDDSKEHEHGLIMAYFFSFPNALRFFSSDALSLERYPVFVGSFNRADLVAVRRWRYPELVVCEVCRESSAQKKKPSMPPASTRPKPVRGLDSEGCEPQGENSLLLYLCRNTRFHGPVEHHCGSL